MGWPKLLCLVRHAESEGNIISLEERPKFDKSPHDYGLTDLGKLQAKHTGEYLRKHYGLFDTYYTSYYTRAKDTMNIIYPAAKVWEDSRVAEAQRGIYHFLTHDEIQAKYPEELGRKDREGLYHYRPPGGENWPDVELRIHSFLDTLYRDCDGHKVLVVAHGHWLVMLQKVLERFSVEEALRRYKEGIVKNASVSTYNGSTAGLKPGLINVAPWEGKV